VKLHQHETFQHLQQVLADRLINTFALICVVGLPVALYRWFELGFQPIFIQHIALSLIVLIAAICKKRIKAIHLIILVVVILTTMSFPGAATFGLQSGPLALVFLLYLLLHLFGDSSLRLFIWVCGVCLLLG
jgi:uncharacterized membrane protein YfhO